MRAYRSAAASARAHPRSLARLVDGQGRAALEALPGIGKSIAALIDGYVHTGRSALLDRLEGSISPEDLLTTVPGIGEELAHRIHDELGVETLEELELAAHDGRLSSVRGMGPRRVRGIRDSLAGILTRSSRRRARRVRSAVDESEPHSWPDVAVLLEIDRDYRAGAELGRLRTIAPRRFNPEGKAWLPVLHTARGGWEFTALFSNTARAHELGRTRDWVVIYFERDGHESQCTVVTERRGPLAGRRVVRGREEECSGHYASSAEEHHSA